MDDTVTISKQQYEQLIEDSDILQCLRNAGVDNWDGWDFAMEEFHALDQGND